MNTESARTASTAAATPSGGPVLWHRSVGPSLISHLHDSGDRTGG